MAVASIAIPGSVSAAVRFDEDYIPYTNLSDAELLQLAIERSLEDNYVHQNSYPSIPTPVVERPPNVNLQQRHYVPPPQVNNFPSANPPSANPRKDPTTASSDASIETDISFLIKNGNVAALANIAKTNPNSLIKPNEAGWIALHDAAYYGQVKCINVLFEAHPHMINYQTLKGQTPLLFAVAMKTKSCVKYLLRAGADPNRADKERESPLFKACEEDSNEDIVFLLLKFGASVNQTCCQGMTALHETARTGQLNICKMLCDAGAKVNATNIYGIRPLFTASQNGKANILKFLYRKGDDVNGQAEDGATPLYEACKNNQEAAVETLLSLRANANRANRSGLLPIHVAARVGNTRIMSMLIPVTSQSRVRRSGISPIHFAADHNQDHILEMLVKAGYDVNAQLSDDHAQMYQDRRRTSLYFSVLNGNLKAVEMLLEAGANPNLDKFNSLLVAVKSGFTDMIPVLVQYGADVNAYISTQPSTFPSVIMLSITCMPTLKYLMDNGCDALSCFNCVHGSRPHPPIPINTPPNFILREDIQTSLGSYNSDVPTKASVQFCEVISDPVMCKYAGPIIHMLLDYVGHVQLCSRLLELLQVYSDWEQIKEKAMPPHPLIQLCRLTIRQSVGIQRLKFIDKLSLPARLIKFLKHDVSSFLDN